MGLSRPACEATVAKSNASNQHRRQGPFRTTSCLTSNTSPATLRQPLPFTPHPPPPAPEPRSQHVTRRSIQFCCTQVLQVQLAGVLHQHVGASLDGQGGGLAQAATRQAEPTGRRGDAVVHGCREQGGCKGRCWVGLSWLHCGAVCGLDLNATSRQPAAARQGRQAAVLG